MCKINAVFQYNIIIFQGQSSTISAFSIEKNSKNSWHFYCKLQYGLIITSIAASPSTLPPENTGKSLRNLQKLTLKVSYLLWSRFALLCQKNV